MISRILSAVFFLSFFSYSFGQSLNLEFLDYINKYHEIAIEEMERAGIPASIKLAQGLLESNAGRSFLAKRGNNHFGIKCGDGWSGKTVHREDDDYDDKGKLVESCFRSYKTVEACYIAHSEFLRDPKKESRYGFLFRLRPTDYKRWAEGLKRAGYATSATYADKLIDLIERYELHKYDLMSALDLDTPSDAVAAAILSTNDVKYTLAEGNETLEDIAKRTDVALRNILKYNEIYESGDAPLTDKARVYIQPKRNAYRGRQVWHKVAGFSETMADISQRYGVKLSKLYKRNRMTTGTEPAIGEQIKLRGGKVKTTPKLRKKTDVPPPLPPPVLNRDMDTISTTPPPLPRTNEEAKPDWEKDTLPEITPDLNLPVKDTTTTKPLPQIPPTPPSIPTEVEEEKDPLNEDIFGQDKLKEEAPIDNKPENEVSAAYHTVVQGDTLWNISRRYGITVEELKKLNNKSDNNIKIGMRLRVR